MKKNKKWQKPKLIVLVRGDRQESVLLNCKTCVIGMTGINAVDMYCYITNPLTGGCTAWCMTDWFS